MTTPTRIIVQWSFAGILVGVVFGTTGYASGLEYFKEPPPYAAIVIAEIECKRANLDHPSWLVIDELNYTTTDNLVDFVGLAPLGAFSSAFLAAIAQRIKALRARGRVAIVKRT